MHLNFVIYLLVFSLFLTNVIVVSIEPITMGIGAAAMGKRMMSYGRDCEKKEIELNCMLLFWFF